MKKYLVFILLATLVLLLTACSADINNNIIHGTPRNGVFDAPKDFYLDWDIESVRDNSAKKDGHYSMPVYMFETYDEYLHLLEIVGMDEIGAEIDNTDYCPVCDSSEPCDHDKYNEKFFESYTLLVGWHQYSGVVISNHDKVDDIDDPQIEDESAHIVAKYQFTRNGELVVYLQGEKSDNDEAQQWVLVAVPKKNMTDCESIAFFVELPQE